MKSISIISIFIAISFSFACCQDNSDRLNYIEEVKPSLKPVIFGKDFISKESRYEFGSVFNKEGNEFYFGVEGPNGAHIKYTTIKDGKWIEPVTIISGPKFGYNDPFLSPDENRLYYISDQPKNSEDETQDHDIWYSERVGQNWSEPINAGNKINSDASEYYISFTNDGSMYFSSNKEDFESGNSDFDIYKSQSENGKFLDAVKLSDAVNTDNYEADVFVAPDESYLIFCARRKSGLGRGDLYISFKDDNGNWTKSVNMGPEINSKSHELCPFVTKDGKYFFYTSNQDIYWVSTKVFDEIKEGIK